MFGLGGGADGVVVVAVPGSWYAESLLLRGAARGCVVVRGGRRFCNFVGRQQLVERAPVSRMPLCGLRKRDYD